LRQKPEINTQAFKKNVAKNFDYVYTDEKKVEGLSVDDLRKKHEEMTKKGA